MLIVRLVPQLSVAVGALKFHALPHSTVLLAGQFTTETVVSTTVTNCSQVLRLLHGSRISHVRVAVYPQLLLALVVVVRTRMVRLVPQLSVAVGALKLHTLPHSTVLFGAQFTTGTVVSTTVTTCVQVSRLVQESKISQARVAMEPHAPVKLVTVVSARIVTLVPRQ